MKISYNWLREYVDFVLTPKDLGEVLTAIGLEVENIIPYQSVPGGLKDVVIGEVKECVKHPDADKLSVTKVDVGQGGLLQIVCGAPNVSAGQKVAVALVGATLYPANGEKLVIKKAKIRGVESHGMLCAEDELGLGQRHDGIMVLPAHLKAGTPAAEYFEVESDFVYEIGLTPNRGDAFSHIGVARDLAAALNVAYKSPVNFRKPDTSHIDFSAVTSSPIKVEVLEPELCLRYSGILLKNVKVGESPRWLKNRLQAIGVKTINNVVDVTNYVLHEYGQPLHAFDAARIKGNRVIVKKLPQDTPFITLDNSSIRLHADDLMICNEEEGMCIAGVYGGLHSGVTPDTVSVFLESACFLPASVRKTSLRHQLRTDSAMRFEKGTDPNITVEALKRAVQLLQQIAGAEIASGIIDVYPRPVAGHEVKISIGRILRLAGFDIPPAVIRQILSHLEISIIHEEADNWLLRVPAFKTDVTREADIAEEILRIYGYNSFSIPQAVRASLELSPAVHPVNAENAIAEMLSGFGLHEICTNSVSSSSYVANEEEKQKLVMLLNSQTAELDSLRHTMLYAGLEVISYNLNRRQSDLRLYDFGKIYTRTAQGYTEQKRLSVFLTGRTFEDNWIGKAEPYNFYHIKHIVNAIFYRLGYSSIPYEECNLPDFHYGLTAVMEGETVASFGAVHPRILQQTDVRQEVFYADINWEFLLAKTAFAKTVFAELPRFPSVRRDISMILPEEVTYRHIEEIAARETKKLLRGLSLFDVYKGDKISPGKKSYAISLVFQHEDRTLTDEEVDKIMVRLMGKLESELKAEIRKN
ncbi:MAG: phenylalanine--tRNA ligase subunit beta [Chitinophagales bacterium]|nr:phenylalanine--tRNA ligase subunit beta [Chitinophagales bacterium]MDW8417889.1 phenylalanine--tRNA ligase subunit beta [Chitinophagales bacterium]